MELIKNWAEAPGRPVYELMLNLDAPELWCYIATKMESTQEIWERHDGTWMLWLLARSVEHLAPEEREPLNSICKELGGDVSQIPAYWDKVLHGSGKPINFNAKPKALAEAVKDIIAKMPNPLRDAIASDVILKYIPSTPMFSFEKAKD